jgi:hypothetical protein
VKPPRPPPRPPPPRPPAPVTTPLPPSREVASIMLSTSSFFALSTLPPFPLTCPTDRPQYSGRQPLRDHGRRVQRGAGRQPGGQAARHPGTQAPRQIDRHLRDREISHLHIHPFLPEGLRTIPV